VSIEIDQNGTEKTLKGSHVLVAAGRIPNTEGLGLELAGIELTDRGYIKVNERLQTTAPGVWAIGEVAGSPQFTHISVDDFRVVHDNLSGVQHVAESTPCGEAELKVVICRECGHVASFFAVGCR
jgi:pyruvate/2-oxoglutarate dehydrogenase complex dihydrolipoamide dehydrogenase (E3) component